jgi:hypothetical protein
VGDLDSFSDELDSIFDEPTAAAPPATAAPPIADAGFGVPALVAEFAPLNRRRVRGDPPLSEAEVERWLQLRELLEYEFGTANPPLAGSRRRALRVPSDFKLRIAGGPDPVCSLRDFSENGAFIETSEPPAAGSVLELNFEPGNGEPPLRLEAVVKWGRELPNMDGPAGVGVEFQNVEDADFVALERLVDRAFEALRRGGP